MEIDRRRFVLIAAAVALGPRAAAAGYRDYAARLLRNPPAGVTARPDLEVYLGELASGYRTANSRPPLAISDLAVDACRAQALDMMIGNYVGHESGSGLRFRDRATAYIGEDIAAFGENAARDRSDGPIDKARARRLFQQWVESRGHRNNLMKRDYIHVSTGALQKGHHLYSVQLYWSKPVAKSGGFY